MSQPVFAHLTPKATVALLRHAAKQLEGREFGARVFAWRRLTVVWETQTPPKQLRAIDRQRSASDIFGTAPQPGDGRDPTQENMH